MLKNYTLMPLRQNVKFKKILIAAGIFPPDIGGPAIYAYNIATGFSRMGLKVRVLCYSARLDEKPLPFQVVRISRKYPAVLRYLFYLCGTLRLGLGADVIFAQGPISAGIPAFFAAKVLRKKFIVKIVGDAAWERRLENKKNQNDFQVSAIYAMQKFICRNAERIVVPSLYLKSIVKGWGIDESKIYVIHNAVKDLSAGQTISRAEAKRQLGLEGEIILSAGRLMPWKGFAGLIIAMPNLLKHNPDFRLVIAGEGPLFNDLRLMIDDLRLTENIKLVGGIAHDELQLYFRAADIFVLNSSYEGLSHVMLEAMAEGVPVAATNAGGNRELIEDGINGFLVDAGNGEELVNKIVKLSMDKNLQEKFIANSKNKLSNFSLEKMLEETARVVFN